MVMKNIGIVAHSAEGGALCFLTTCHEGAVHLGAHMHPTILLSAIPMGVSMPAWESDDYDTVAKYLAKGVQQVADAGADFYVCPDNTAHIALQRIALKLPLPGLHIADVVCHEILANNWTTVGLLGTQWTMTGSVYRDRLEKHNVSVCIPNADIRKRINSAIFEELCQGVFRPETTRLFVEAIAEMKADGADCVILGCTEIPLIINADNSPLPVLDSTRLLAKYAVVEALKPSALSRQKGWLPLKVQT